MESKKYIRMWAEENHNSYDLSGIIRNYGPDAIFGLSVENAVAYAKNFHAEFYLEENELKKLAEKGYRFYIENNGLNKLLQKIEKETKKNNDSMKHLISLDLSKLSNEELFQEYLKYVKPYESLMRLYVATQPHYVAKIEEELKKKLSNFENNEEIFNILTSPDVEFVFQDKGDFFKKSFAELLGAEDAVIDKTLLNERLYEIKIKDKTKKEDVIRENFLSDDLVQLGNILATIGEKRFGMRFVWMPVIYYLELFIIELKSRYNISKNTLRKYDEEEINDLILDGKIIEDNILEERMKGFAKVLKSGEVETLTGEKAVEFIANINNFDKLVKELKGNVASKGKIRGKVVIFSYTQSSNHAEKINNMLKGDILVSEMTRPNIMTACEKAGAIITDEGGITCHAAIVARELKIPCIIGTKIATQVLKDGDLVEVDADKGVIKIIKKAKK